MTELIAVSELIKKAKRKGIDLGRGDPYNRLRYYTKIGWLPHMVRKSGAKGKVEGHYPTWVFERLTLIDDLKSEGYSNTEIERRLKTHNVKTSLGNIFSFVDSPAKRNTLLMYLSFTLLFVIFMFELGIVSNRGTKLDLINSTSGGGSTVLGGLDSGQALFPSDAKTVFVSTSSVSSASKVYFTFTDNYAPATRFWIANVVPFEGFYVELDSPLAQNTSFNWWVTN